MDAFIGQRIAWAGLWAASVFACACGASVDSQRQQRFTLEDLYSLPRIIGTAPKEFAWSSNGRRLAFLWNDEGTNFYDVWTIAVDNPKPVHVSRMPRPPAPGSGTDAATVEAGVAAERAAGVQAVVWHPDGRQLIMTFRGDLYMGGGNEAPRKVGDAFSHLSLARFSPDGRMLAFVRDGNLWVAEVVGDTFRSPTSATALAAPDVVLESYTWSPDSRQLSFVERDSRALTRRVVPDYLTPETTTHNVARPAPGEPSELRRLGVVSVADRHTRWIDLGPNLSDQIFAYEWAPDSQAIAVDKSDVFVKDRRITVIDVSTGRAQEWYREQNPDNVTAQWSVGWAPGGRGLYMLSDRDEDYHIYLMSGPGASPRRITQGNWAVSDFKISPSANAVYFVGNEGRAEERHIFRVGLDGGQVTRLSRRPGTHDPVFSPDGRMPRISSRAMKRRTIFS